MDINEAYKMKYVSAEEEASIQRYLGFQHTSMNILADLKPEYYRDLAK